MKTIKVSEEKHSKLISIAAGLALRVGERKTMDDAVGFLLDYYEENKT